MAVHFTVVLTGKQMPGSLAGHFVLREQILVPIMKGWVGLRGGGCSLLIKAYFA
jgi:hypothetical protein